MPEPYYQADGITIFCGDMRNHPIDADLCLADPPYGETSLIWDCWPVNWTRYVAPQSMWVFGSMRMFLDHATAFEGWNLSQDIVWEKPNGTGFATDRFRRVHEHATHWYRGKWGDIYHETPRVQSNGIDKSGARRTNVPHTGEIELTPYVDDGKRLMRSVIYAQNEHGRALNETQKPLAAVLPLIEYACPPGGLVLDPFMGSGTTLLAARATGRRAIGIELREEQCEVAVARLAQGVLV